MFWQKFTFIYILLAIYSNNAASKDRNFRPVTPEFGLTMTYNLGTTSKSELVASNDLGTGLSYGVGGYTGKNGTLGFFLNIDSNATTFELNNSSNSVTWQDTVIRYRWSYFYFGALFSVLSYEVTNQGTPLLDISASGMGGNAGVLIPLGNSGSLFVDLCSVTMSKTVNALTTEAEIGARTDINIGASIDITQRLVDLIFGYKQQQFTVTTDSSYTELTLGTYLGFRFSFYF